MKRFLLSGLGAAFLMTLAGCGGGGIEEGTPPLTKPDVPLNSVKADMSTGKINPNNLPKGNDDGAPAAVKK